VDRSILLWLIVSSVIGLVLHGRILPALVCLVLMPERPRDVGYVRDLCLSILQYVCNVPLLQLYNSVLSVLLSTSATEVDAKTAPYLS